MHSEFGRIRRLLIDACSAFPYLDRSAKQSTRSWSQTPPVTAALAVLPESEKERVLKYYFPKDAALSLASFLLKHYVITQTCNVPWRDTAVSQEKTIQNGKPFFEPGGVEFNVSHHGEAAVIVVTSDKNVKVGIDLTMIDASRDGRTIQREGFEGWVRIFSEVFSDTELRNILQSKPQSPRPSQSELMHGMRAFYSHWALKEAYFKMTGDALLASWLKDLEFSNVSPPAAASDPAGAESWAMGQTTYARASLCGQDQADCQLDVTALGMHYIVATSVTDSALLPPFELVDVARDILPLAST